MTALTSFTLAEVQTGLFPFLVMAGLDPAIPGRLPWDPRVKPGDDG